jgi:Flp pilus assembly protein TadG
MSKTLRSLALTLAAAALALAACSKTSKAPATMDYQGVKVDLPKLQTMLETNTNTEVQNQLTQVSFGMRYGDYTKALMALDQLAHNDAVTPEQKKVVSEVFDQVKQVANKPPTPPASQ